MARKTHQIKKWLPCPLWDFAGLQNWLNEQARAGYALEKWPGFWFIGRVIFREDPSAVHARYCLDPIQEHFGIAKLREQEAGYRELGWHYVDKIQNYYAIYRCDDPQAPDLYTDLESLAWAMKKQVRIACLRLLFWLVWAAVLFQDEWPRLLHEREAVVMELILHSDVLIPLYAILLILILNALFHGINTLRGVRRIRARLRRGEQPIPRPRRYPEPLHNLVDWSLLGALVLYLGCLGLSGTMRTKTLSGPEEWDFPHVTLEEVLPPGPRSKTMFTRRFSPPTPSTARGWPPSSTTWPRAVWCGWEMPSSRRPGSTRSRCAPSLPLWLRRYTGAGWLPNTDLWSSIVSTGRKTRPTSTLIFQTPMASSRKKPCPILVWTA